MCDKITFEIDMQGYDGPEFITVPGTSVLPIELITFDAIKKDRQVELSWKTATETNNDFFTIARSVDGKYWEDRSEEHTSELQSRPHLVCRLLLEKKKKKQ